MLTVAYSFYVLRVAISICVCLQFIVSYDHRTCGCGTSWTGRRIRPRI